MYFMKCLSSLSNFAYNLAVRDLNKNGKILFEMICLWA